MTVYFCSDLHLGHGNAIKWRTQFSSPEEHDAYMFDNVASCLHKKDILFALGDIAISQAGMDMLQELPVCQKKILVLGNHDIERGLKLVQFMKVFDEIQAFRPYKKFWLSHCPIHPEELRGKLNIHGHVHSNTLKDPRYLNVCPENLIPIVGKPIISIDQIYEIFKERNLL